LPINDVVDLRPVVEKAIKALYGENAENVRIRYADTYPIFGEKTFWLVKLDFNDKNFRYDVEMHVSIEDGKIIKIEEKQRSSSI
jgi:hypothetical protein